MRIAYVCQTYPPEISGAAAFTQNLAEGMTARGHRVLVIAASDRGSAYAGDTPMLRLSRLRSYRNPMRKGQRFAPWPLHRMRQEFQTFAPEVVHVSDVLQAALAGVIATAERHVPSVLTTHQLPWFVSPHVPAIGGLRTAFEDSLWSYARWLARRYTSLVSPSHAVAEEVARRTGLLPQVISYGVQTQVFAPAKDPEVRADLRRSFGLDPDLPVILHVGQLHKVKKVDIVCQAAAAAIRQIGAQLVIVGDGPSRKGLEHLCARLGIRERAHFTGYVRVDAGLPDLYRLATLFVTASEIETQGLVLLEAAATGLPLVAVQTGCIPEIVHHKENGLLVPPGDVAAMGAAIASIVSDPDKQRVMGAASQVLAAQHKLTFTLDRYEALYRSLIDAQADPSRGESEGPRRLEDPETGALTARLSRCRGDGPGRERP